MTGQIIINKHEIKGPLARAAVGGGAVVLGGAVVGAVLLAVGVAFVVAGAVILAAMAVGAVSVPIVLARSAAGRREVGPPAGPKVLDVQGSVRTLPEQAASESREKAPPLLKAPGKDEPKPGSSPRQQA
jgi:hypothetical protein